MAHPLSADRCRQGCSALLIYHSEMFGADCDPRGVWTHARAHARWPRCVFAGWRV